jgi:hypothetical protein
MLYWSPTKLLQQSVVSVKIDNYCRDGDYLMSFISLVALMRSGFSELPAQ